LILFPTRRNGNSARDGGMKQVLGRSKTIKFAVQLFFSCV
jgi:hypothetical protein